MTCELRASKGEVPPTLGDRELTPIPCPDTEPILSNIERLVKELTAITETVRSVQGELPCGRNADEEPWCLADII